MIRKFRLWIIFVFTVTVTMVASFFITGWIAYSSLHKGTMQNMPPKAWFPLVSLGVTAIAVSISLMVMISKQFFHPIEEMIQAFKLVTAGDFDVRLPEKMREAEIMEMNINFNKMVKELSSMEMLQADFIQNISHEIKTPLAAIEGYTSLLYSEDLSEEQKEYITMIQSSTRRLSYLTGNILKLSKLENQQIISEKDHFSLDEQLRQVVLLLEAYWSEKDLSMDIELSEVEFYGNEELLFQVWTNLLSNAIKFTPKGGSVAVRLKKERACVRVEVEDSGIGMAKDIQEKIFDKFYQGEKHRNTEGNGLGLALVKKIVDLCGGTIEVKSEPDCGSVFTVELPI